MKKLICLLLFIPALVLAQGKKDFSGTWEILPGKSVELARFGKFNLEIKVEGGNVTITKIKNLRSSEFKETNNLLIGRTTEKKIELYGVRNNMYMAVREKKGDIKTFKTSYDKKTNVIKVVENTPVLISQGETNITTVHEYSLNMDNTLTYNVKRSSRKEGDPLVYTFKPSGSKKAWYMELEDDWSIDGKLDRNALMISLQGAANRNKPGLYFVYPKTWDFNFTPNVMNFLKTQHNFTFGKLRTVEQAVKTFRDKIKGYIVWDKKVRTSLIVSYTLAGLEDAIIVSSEYIPLMKKHNIPLVKDFRGQFSGQSDLKIYRWAKNEYWDRVTKDCIVWLGGEHGRIVKPGVGDWGMYNKAFFQDLSCRESDVEEFAMSKELLGELNPMSMVYGWHSYKKDGEGEFTALCSSFGHRISGLHTLPNMSFLTQEPVTPGFEFKNRHNAVPGKEYKPEKKVYIACIQTDCLGLGAWTQPGRGSIPYAWEVTMNWKWMAPAMLEFFYTEATQNDYFIGALGGPGYMYPRAIPKEKRPVLFKKAAKMMKSLDLNYFEIMDFAYNFPGKGDREFNANLPLDLIQDYYKYMPETIGFGNGYYAANTFFNDGKRSLISFDYYLGPERSEDNAVGDLKELIELNGKKPYFLLLHVRQWSNIERVKRILDRLGPGVEVVPLDIFTKLSNKNPTFREWYIKE